MNDLLTQLCVEEIERRRWHGRSPTPEYVASRKANRAARQERGGVIGSVDEFLAEFVPIMGGDTNFTLTLDTTAPADPSITLAGGAAYTSARAITATIATTDAGTTGYQMKIFGDVDPAANANIQPTEGASSWIAYSTSQAVTLSTGDGNKTVSLRLRDDVWNETTVVTDSITLDTTLPVPNVTVGPDVTRISKVSGKRVASFSWQADEAFVEYKIKVVPSAASLESAGTVIPTTNGSTNMAATGTFAATTNINSTIDGRDLEIASAGDGNKIIKVFVRDDTGNWSV